MSASVARLEALLERVQRNRQRPRVGIDAVRDAAASLHGTAGGEQARKQSLTPLEMAVETQLDASEELRMSTAPPGPPGPSASGPVDSRAQAQASLDIEVEEPDFEAPRGEAEPEETTPAPRARPEPPAAPPPEPRAAPPVAARQAPAPARPEPIAAAPIAQNGPIVQVAKPPAGKATFGDLLDRTLRLRLRK